MTDEQFSASGSDPKIPQPPAGTPEAPGNVPLTPDQASPNTEPMPGEMNTTRGDAPGAAPSNANSDESHSENDPESTESESPRIPGDPTESSSPAMRAGSQPPLAGQRMRIGSQRYGQMQRKAPMPRPAPHPGAPKRESSPDNANEPERQFDGDEPVSDQSAKEQSPGMERAPRQSAGRVEPPNRRQKLTAEMEQEYEAAFGEMSLDDAMKKGAPTAENAELPTETRVRGRIIAIHRDNVFVDLGGRRQGVLQLAVFAETPAVDSMIDVVVARLNAAEGLYELILPGGSVKVEDWSQVSEGMVVEARVTGHNKGGLECEVGGLRGFIPASQVSLYRVEDLAPLVGERFPAVVTEANPDKRNLVLSRRAHMEREKAAARESLLATLEVGQIREGTVRSLQDFGAFVDLGGIDGLIHISQLSWERVKHASDVLELGQKVKVRVQKIDAANGKLSLAFRDLAENPWDSINSKFPVKSRVRGVVTRIMDFGAFVRLEAGVEGLVHVSELSHKRVFRVTDVLQEGQEVEVQVQSVDREQQRIGLSMKALEARAPTKPVEPEQPEAAPYISRRKTPLQGGVKRESGGEKFGLKW